MDRKRQLLIKKMDQKIAPFTRGERLTVPAKGWINALRTAMNMTLHQLGKRLGVSRSAVKRMEIREESGSITINNLKQAAEAMGMQLFYIILPPGKSLEQHIYNQARKVAQQIVGRTATTMDLEDQSTSQQRREEEIDNLTRKLVDDIPKYLWNDHHNAAG